MGIINPCLVQYLLSGVTNFMKIHTLSLVMAVSILLAGCDNEKPSSRTPPSPSSEQTNATSVVAPVAQSAMDAWQLGDRSTAVSNYLTADWSARPLFAAGSALSFTEDQFKSLSEADRQVKSGEMITEVESLKRLAAAVAQAGRDAAAKGDSAQARKHFTSLKQCGAALDSPDCLSLVQLVGKGLKKMADSELAKIGP